MNMLLITRGFEHAVAQWAELLDPTLKRPYTEIIRRGIVSI
jgi:hypothetical protein